MCPGPAGQRELKTKLTFEVPMARKKKKQQTAPQASKKAGQAVVPRYAPRLSNCATEWARSLGDPFGTPPVCIPTLPPIPSHKAKVWAKGTFGIGTAGFGFVLLDPYQMAVRDSGSGTAGYPVWFSSTAFAGTATASSGSATGLLAANSNAPYVGTDIALAKAQWRLVSAGLRVKFIGTSVADSGEIVGLAHPNNCSLTPATVATLQAFPGVRAFSCLEARKWLHVFWRPSTPGDTDYAFTISTNTSYPMMQFVVENATAGQSCAYEAVANFEYVGYNAYSAGRTPSVSDPVGFAAVTNSADATWAGAAASVPGRVTSVLNAATKALGDISGVAAAAAGTAKAYRALTHGPVFSPAGPSSDPLVGWHEL